jgi:hypothetical protein
MGQTDVVDEERLDEEEGMGEWQLGVFRAERPALRAMCRRGQGGRENRSWCVRMKRVDR